jgi:hypothetical protein
MEGFLVHTAEADLDTAIAAVRTAGTPIKLSGTLFAIRTDTPGQALLDLITAAIPKTGHALVARANGAYVKGGDYLLASAAKLLA